MNTNIDYDLLEKDVVEIFQSGFACSESTIYALRKHLELDIPDSAIAMSTGFPWGLAGGGCLCGAVAGGTMVLGFLYGRSIPGTSNEKCQALTKEFHDRFKKEFGATCCRVLIKDYPDKFSPERKAHCIDMVKFTTKVIAEMLVREA